MPEIDNADAVVRNERVLAFTPIEIFAAFQQPELLARWWGPNGFTNTFQEFEFKTGGRWLFVMHGPNGANYENESVFQELVPSEKIVIDHVSPPKFILTVTLTAHSEGTHVDWAQEFENATAAAKLRPICEPSNEENLDRLESVLAGKTP